MRESSLVPLPYQIPRWEQRPAVRDPRATMRGMRRFPLVLSLLLVFLAGALPAYAANFPLLDPNFSIVPAQCTACPCNYYGFLQLIQNLMNAGVGLGIIAFSLALAYAGATIMLNPTSPEMRSTARSMLLNIAVGLVILLSAWLVVDFVMKLIYDPTATLNGSEAFGPWNEILASKDQKWCIDPTAAKPIEGLLGTAANYVLNGNKPAPSGTGGAGGTGAPIVIPQGGGGACSESTLQSAASKAGVSLSSSELKTFACLARYESSCGNIVKNYNFGKGSSAAGAFQVTLDGNSSCYDTPACRTAAGVAGKLDCDSAFKNGNPIPGNPLAQKCVNASANLSCSISAAKCVKNQQGYKAWTADPNSRGQQACIRQYGT
jgi:hypothetical protein